MSALITDKYVTLNQVTKETHDDTLPSRGGCALLASPGLTLLPKDSYCNGICELLIFEIPQLNTAAIVVYNPPKPNFNVSKFQEVMLRIETYLEINAGREEQLDITVLGDFNFPPNIVSWEK